MPCRDEYAERESARKDWQEARDRNDELAQMLCWLCGTVADEEVDYLDGNPKLAKWWQDHQKADTKRVTEEMCERVAKYAKLGPDSLAKYFIDRAEKVHAVSQFHREWFVKLAHEVWQEYIGKQKDSDNKKKLAKAAMKKVAAALTDEELAAIGLKRK